MTVKQFYRTPGLSPGAASVKLSQLQSIVPDITNLETESCFNVKFIEPLSSSDVEKLSWILSDSLSVKPVQDQSFLTGENIIEVGPRLNFSTAFSSNAVSICQSVGLQQITRLELSVRYSIKAKVPLTKEKRAEISAALHDKMTQCEYKAPLTTFDVGVKPESWFYVDVMGQGRKALEEVNSKLGLAFDDWDLDYYTTLFRSKLKRNPTSVECFDLAQSNSEHSRHWFFKGKMVLDGEEIKQSLIDMIIETQSHTNQNNVIKFSDNSSAIEGFSIDKFRPTSVDRPSPFAVSRGDCHLIFTAETHNFPTGVAPFSGATTGTGGRLRDVQSVGRGGHPIAGTAGYSVGNLNIPGYNLPWEDVSLPYPGNFAPPLEVLVEASNGASDYGNKFGEPLLCGFARSFGLVMPSGRREWIKPIMFSGGIGQMDHDMANKLSPLKGMKVVKVGGPIYRIGVGGGAASSVEVQGDNKVELDFGAVQRGDAEMEHKLNRVIRACLELGKDNPILSIHDQGAGGNGNVLKELVEPSGAVIFSKLFTLGDPTISALELWGAEYQESNALLCKAEDVPLLLKIAQRERCPINIVGTVTGTGKIILSESDPDVNLEEVKSTNNPVDLDLELVLGKMPQKVFQLQNIQDDLPRLTLPEITVEEALDRVLRLPSVASKRYLTSKVDRCVTGLVAQQQCVGPLHTPLADVAVTAVSLFNVKGIASAIGEQPIKGLVSPEAGARMSVAESLSNLVFAAITDLRDVKCSGNWMWAAKLPGEGAALVKACEAMCRLMSQIGIAVDGGKDSLSMAARVGSETVKAPGTLVISTYAPCPDVRKVITPDLKESGSSLLWVRISNEFRLGGSAIAQCYSQLGNDVPDVDDPAMLVRAFNVTQRLIKDNKILSGHDVSDGGLITTLLEMCFAGIYGTNVNVVTDGTCPINVLFAEEVGWLLEVQSDLEEEIKDAFKSADVGIVCIGSTGARRMDAKCVVRVNGQLVLEKRLSDLFSLWEETSYQLELHQTTPSCAHEEYKGLASRTGPTYDLTFDPDTFLQRPRLQSPPKVAVIREEGSNGDREMSASLFQAGFDVYDVTMQDLLNGTSLIDEFRGVIFPGGFSYADVLGSAKGWAGSLIFHPKLSEQFQRFVKRPDTFSLGVCNGCQLMSLLGWLDQSESEANSSIPKSDVVLERNKSERFECRFSTVRIESSNAIMFRGMDASVMGVWSAHGEGRFTFRSSQIQRKIEESGSVALRFVDDQNQPTEVYPMNPNGSPNGVAGICSRDGRHLAMMPHPERATQLWQWPYLPRGWDKTKSSPWAAMFRNALDWCVNSQ